MTSRRAKTLTPERFTICIPKIPIKNREDAVDFEMIGRRTRPRCLSVLTYVMALRSMCNEPSARNRYGVLTIFWTLLAFSILTLTQTRLVFPSGVAMRTRCKLGLKTRLLTLVMCKPIPPLFFAIPRRMIRDPIMRFFPDITQILAIKILLKLTLSEIYEEYKL
jgi:hypothetical protein